MKITLFSRRRAERIVCADRGKHNLRWSKFYDTDEDGGLRARYMIFYYPVDCRKENRKSESEGAKDDTLLRDCEIDEISSHVSRRAASVLGGKESAAYRDKNIREQVFNDIYSQIRREYGLTSSYKGIKRKYLADAHDFIDCYELPRFLEEQVTDANARICVV